MPEGKYGNPQPIDRGDISGANPRQYSEGYGLEGGARQTAGYEEYQKQLQSRADWYGSQEFAEMEAENRAFQQSQKRDLAGLLDLELKTYQMVLPALSVAGAIGGRYLGPKNLNKWSRGFGTRGALSGIREITRTGHHVMGLYKAYSSFGKSRYVKPKAQWYRWAKGFHKH